MKRCARCLLPETIPGISFGHEGLCSYCRNYRSIEYRGEEELVRLLEEARSGNREYDCIVPLSGGRDSSYVLYLAKKRYGLKVLAVNYDNEFRSKQALANMKAACSILDVDFVSLRSKRGIAGKIVEASIRNSSREGLKSLATSFCDACAYGYQAVVYIMAEKHKVPLILWGSSEMEYTGHLTDEFFSERKSPWRKILNQTRVFRLKILKLLQRLEFPVPGNLSVALRLGSPWLMNDKISEIRVFDYIPWKQDTIVRTIREELGWRKPEDSASTWRTDCELEKWSNTVL